MHQGLHFNSGSPEKVTIQYESWCSCDRSAGKMTVGFHHPGTLI